MTTKEKFNRAVLQSKALTKKPTNSILLKLYSFYKQATLGDVEKSRPKGFDFEAIAKFNAWEALKGVNSEDAMQQYTTLINQLEKEE